MLFAWLLNIIRPPRCDAARAARGHQRRTAASSSRAPARRPNQRAASVLSPLVLATLILTGSAPAAQESSPARAAARVNIAERIDFAGAKREADAEYRELVVLAAALAAFIVAWALRNREPGTGIRRRIEVTPEEFLLRLRAWMKFHLAHGWRTRRSAFKRLSTATRFRHQPAWFSRSVAARFETEVFALLLAVMLRSLHERTKDIESSHEERLLIRESAVDTFADSATAAFVAAGRQAQAPFIEQSILRYQSALAGARPADDAAAVFLAELSDQPNAQSAAIQPSVAAEIDDLRRSAGRLLRALRFKPAPTSNDPAAAASRATQTRSHDRAAR